MYPRSTFAQLQLAYFKGIPFWIGQASSPTNNYLVPCAWRYLFITVYVCIIEAFAEARRREITTSRAGFHFRENTVVAIQHLRNDKLTNPGRRNGNFLTRKKRNHIHVKGDCKSASFSAKSSPGKWTKLIQIVNM